MNEADVIREAQAAFVLLMILAGVGAVLTAHLRVDTCDQCPHCRAERQRREDAERRRLHDYWHRRPAKGCPYCEK